MQEDCSVQTGPAQEDALFCHQYYSVTDEPAVIRGRLKITFPSLPGWHDVISPICRQLVTGSSALNVNSLDRLKYGWQVKVQSDYLHRYIFEDVLIHRRTRLIRAEKIRQSNHMQSLNCYAHDRRNISEFLWTEPRKNIKLTRKTSGLIDPNLQATWQDDILNIGCDAVFALFPLPAKTQI